MYVGIHYFLIAFTTFCKSMCSSRGVGPKKIFASSINQIIKMKIHEHNKAQGIVNELL